MYKLIFGYLVFIILTSCSSIKETPKSDQKTILSCAQDGNCNIKVMRNSALEILKDPTGQYYPKINSGDRIVIQYEYLKKTDENILDSGYSEVVYLEIEGFNKDIALSDLDLKNAKVFFGKMCFCKGSGYYFIQNGNLSITTKKGDLTNFTLDFSIKKIQHIIKSISYSIK